MKTIILCLVCLCFATSFASHIEQAKAKPFRFVNCAKGHSIANITRFEILSSYPVSLSKNFTCSLDIDLKEDIPHNAMLKMNIYKVTGLLGIKLHAPCLLGIGSCITEHCKFLDKYKEQACPFFQDAPCDCPLKAGYFGGENITVQMPHLGPLVKFIASGDFEVEMKLVVKEKNNKQREIACQRFTGTAAP